MKKFFVSVFILAAAFTFTDSAYADSETATLYVKIKAVSSVTVTCSPVNFPSFDIANPGTQVQAEGQITVNASGRYTVSLDAGRYFNGTNRSLDSEKKLRYRLYQDAARTIEWGDSDVAGTYTAGKSKSGTAGNTAHTVYGALTTAAVAEGDYQDSVIVTITY